MPAFQLSHLSLHCALHTCTRDSVQLKFHSITYCTQVCRLRKLGSLEWNQGWPTQMGFTVVG